MVPGGGGGESEEERREGRGKTDRGREMLLLFVGCLLLEQHASVSQGQSCSDHCMCCHIEIEVAAQTFYLTQSRYAETEPAQSQC